MLGSGTVPSTPQPALQTEEEALEVEDDEDKEGDSEDTQDSDDGEENEGEEEEQEEYEDDEDDVGVGSVLPGQAVLYVSAEESVEQASRCQESSLNPLQPDPTPMP